MRRSDGKEGVRKEGTVVSDAGANIVRNRRLKDCLCIMKRRFSHPIFPRVSACPPCRTASPPPPPPLRIGSAVRRLVGVAASRDARLFIPCLRLSPASSPVLCDSGAHRPRYLRARGINGVYDVRARWRGEDRDYFATVFCARRACRETKRHGDTEERGRKKDKEKEGEEVSTLRTGGVN